MPLCKTGGREWPEECMDTRERHVKMLDVFFYTFAILCLWLSICCLICGKKSRPASEASDRKPGGGAESHSPSVGRKITPGRFCGAGE